MMINEVYGDGKHCSSGLKNELANIISWLCQRGGSALGGRSATAPSGIPVAPLWLGRARSKPWAAPLRAFSCLSFEDKTGNRVNFVSGMCRVYVINKMGENHKCLCLY